jgi:hypothetical protein
MAGNCLLLVAGRGIGKWLSERAARYAGAGVAVAGMLML